MGEEKRGKEKKKKKKSTIEWQKPNIEIYDKQQFKKKCE